mmetsp:Transcript_1243/g.3467  ORF Transcript_1243/g.3467 Transcript_1243/m.3467 type:complete len:212 (-) Transcript_1243:740-1375(-)
MRNRLVKLSNRRARRFITSVSSKRSVAMLEGTFARMPRARTTLAAHSSNTSIKDGTLSSSSAAYNPALERSCSKRDTMSSSEVGRNSRAVPICHACLYLQSRNKLIVDAIASNINKDLLAFVLSNSQRCAVVVANLSRHKRASRSMRMSVVDVCTLICRASWRHNKCALNRRPRSDSIANSMATSSLPRRDSLRALSKVSCSHNAAAKDST